ncbi:RNA methyltransferase [Pleionea litopenaei]|uniref:tRNA (cytidine/uridine-2'-O-)-methyltransferase TrmJ n=1 Tax=Pleionea litopenaei TaxID=3070815 RepID=A0AA51X6T0_9GAMM|nr:RNA methyltransferase [Pleionea sp. HL-JVS1]WMS87607.1 RNA methyltransferase [Pleionea sp. HL-JVS1]
MLNDIHFVLSHTTHPGNIGAAARALKTMGLQHLKLVNPKDFPSAEATRRASRADDILANAQVCNTIEEAVTEAKLIVGTSARSRTLPWPMLEPRELAEKIANDPAQRPVAILFGTENSGLTNEELQMCHYHVCIPTNPEYSSLNVASAIQLITYELRLAALAQDQEIVVAPPIEDEGELPARSEDIEQMFDHWQQVMEHSGFYNPLKPKKIQMRFRRIFNKAQLTDSEVRLLRGYLAAIRKYESQ